MIKFHHDPITPSKYNVGDMVWSIDRNRKCVINAQVAQVIRTQNDDLVPYIQYHLQVHVYGDEYDYYKFVYERLVFDTELEARQFLQKDELAWRLKKALYDLEDIKIVIKNNKEHIKQLQNQAKGTRTNGKKNQRTR